MGIERTGYRNHEGEFFLDPGFSKGERNVFDARLPQRPEGIEMDSNAIRERWLDEQPISPGGRRPKIFDPKPSLFSRI